LINFFFNGKKKLNIKQHQLLISISFLTVLLTAGAEPFDSIHTVVIPDLENEEFSD
jgi:hypothetical protein